MAYYLRIDEGFGGDDGLFGHSFNLNKEQPNLIPVGTESLTTSKNPKVQVTEGPSNDKPPQINGPQSIAGTGERVSTGAES